MIETEHKNRLLFLDVDGTLTDGRVYISAEGEMVKAFNIKDGYAIANILPRYSVIPIIMTGRDSLIVNRRCEELGIKYVYQGVKNKAEKLIEIAELFGKKKSDTGIIREIYYVGDDLPDIECLQIAEVSGCPKDAVNEVKKVCDFVSNYDGGDGAVREFIEWLCSEHIDVEE